MRNHTATHLLQQALRDVLGEHVHQSGSYVDPLRLRFDFSHFQSVSREELNKVQSIVNDKILEALPVSFRVLALAQARKLGAIALFGEKYGDSVRVVEVDGYSVEFCGGTHVSNTGHLGLFRIISEASVAAGIRRIEATTGRGVLEILDSQRDLLEQTCGVLKITSPSELPDRALSAVTALHSAEKRLDQYRKRQTTEESQQIKPVVQLDGIDIYAQRFDGSAEELRNAAGMIRDNNKSCVVLLASVTDGKLALCATCGEDAQKRGIKAGNVVKLAAEKAGGSGGGRADIAMAGARDTGQLNVCLESLPEIVQQLINQEGK